VEGDLGAPVSRGDRVSPRGVGPRVEPGLVALEAPQPYPLANGIEELEESRARVLIIVHLLLGALPGPAVEDADLVPVGEALLVEPGERLLRSGRPESQAVHLDLGGDELEDVSGGYAGLLGPGAGERLLRDGAPQGQELGGPHDDPVLLALPAHADGHRPELLVHAEPVLVLAPEEVAPVIMGPLVDALDRQGPLLQGTGVLPEALACRGLEDAHAVGQSRTMEPVALGASGQADLPLPLAASLVAEERAGLEELVTCARASFASLDVRFATLIALKKSLLKFQQVAQWLTISRRKQDRLICMYIG
jgi:hypothetical protein